ncbi:MAG: hypothetical protein EPN77_19455 [Candidimonas sp.]|nr:MAG: hypothetical protein EPN77_19455 [Candidimonas sp.]
MTEEDIKRNLDRLAAQPAGQDQLARAKVLCGTSKVWNAKLSEFLATKPTRGEMVNFLENLGSEQASEQLNEKINRICGALGIEAPTGVEKLLALQIALQQDQSAALQAISNRAGAPEKASAGTGIASLATAVLLGTILSR